MNFRRDPSYWIKTRWRFRPRVGASEEEAILTTFQPRGLSAILVAVTLLLATSCTTLDQSTAQPEAGNTTNTAAAPGATAGTGLAQVLVIGTYHMANPGLDLINMPADDVTTPERQQEIGELVSRLARFRPTHIAVEATPERAAELTESYREFLATGRLPGASETYQVGFRLAQRLGLSGVHPVDFSRDMDLGKVMGWIAANDAAGMAYLQQTMGAIRNRNAEIMKGSVSEIFARLNSPEQDALHDQYLWLAQKGTSGNAVGAAVVADWYERNLKIFANVARLAETADARVLVLIGAGHATLLRQFVRQAPNLELVEPSLHPGPPSR